MDGFARRKEHSKEDIRKAAWELFSQFGFEKVSMADIAQKAGVSQATIYNNFGSKEALAREFITAAIEQLMNRVQEELQLGEAFDEKITAFIRLIAEMINNGRPSPVNRTIFSASIDLQSDPEIKLIRQLAQEKMTALMLGLVSVGRQQGQVGANLSDAALSLYFRMFMDLFSNPELHNDFRNHPDLVRELGSLMMHGLSGRSAGT